MQSLVTKIGPWGGIDGGRAQDITAIPKRLESITIHSGWTVDSISFIYLDQAGQKHRAGPWGGPGGDPYMVSELPLQSVFDNNHLSICSKIYKPSNALPPFHIIKLSSIAHIFIYMLMNLDIYVCLDLLTCI